LDFVLEKEEGHPAASCTSWVLPRRRTGLGARYFRPSHLRAFWEGAAVMYWAAWYHN